MVEMMEERTVVVVVVDVVVVVVDVVVVVVDVVGLLVVFVVLCFVLLLDIWLRVVLIHQFFVHVYEVSIIKNDIRKMFTYQQNYKQKIEE